MCVLLLLILSLFDRLRYSYRLLNFKLNCYIIILLISFWLYLTFKSYNFAFTKLIFNHGVIISLFTNYTRLFIIIYTIIFFIISLKFFFSDTNKNKDFVEYPLLIALAIFFLLIFTAAFDLMVMYLALEGLSIILYVLAAYPFQQSSIEILEKWTVRISDFYMA